jgi:hypothetical protein
MMALNNADLQLLSMWNNPELNQAIRRMIDCQHSLGRGMTNDERNRLERITAIFPEAPPVEAPPSPARQAAREHFTRAQVWERVWSFLQQFPVLMGSTLEEIVQKLEHLQRNSQ